MKKLLAGLLFTLPAFASAQHTGRVFADHNHNGRYDRGETLLQGISVSDGLHVVQTDRKGCFSLPGHEKERFIFITTPSGYKTANAYYRRIDDSTESYDFGLMPYEATHADGSHQFIHISDTEIGEEQGQDEWTECLREYTAHQKTAFIMHTGDICYANGLKNHIKVMNSTLMPETQVFYAIGNHDLVDGKYGEELFESIYGPTYYSFEVGQVHYIVTPMPFGDRQPSYRMDEVFAWMANDLKTVSKDKSVYVFNHTTPDECGCPDYVYSIKDKEGHLTQSVDLTAHRLKGWLYGHWHVNQISRHPDNGIPAIGTSTPVFGGIDHASSAFRVMHIDRRGDFTSELRYTYIDKSMVISSIQNHQAAVTATGTVPLAVNVYSATSPVTKVSYTCTCAGKVLLADRPLKQQSDFSWTAEMNLPQSADGQTVSVSVEARYTNGEVNRRTASFVYSTQSAAHMVANTEWTNLLGNPEHTGIVTDTLTAPRLVWTAHVGANIYMSAPVVSQGAVYVASLDEDFRGRASLTKMNATDGRVLWKCPLQASVRGSIAITDGLVFAQDVQGQLYAIHTSNGTVAWQKDLQIGATPPMNEGLVAKDGIVYAGTGLQLTAFRAKTGEVIWQNKAWKRREGCVASLTLSEDDVLIGSCHWGALYGNDARTGQLLWADVDSDLRFRAAAPAALGNVMYVTSADALLVVDNKSGRILMRKKLGYRVEVASTPLVTDDAIIFGTSNRGIVALDRQTLQEKWQFKVHGALILSSPYQGNRPATVEASPVLCGNTVYVGASDGTLYAIDARSGRLQWRHHTGAPVFASVAVSGNGLFAVDFGGNVYGFACQRPNE